MPARSSGPVSRPAKVAFAALMLLVAIGVAATASANAAYYKMVACSSTNGAPPFSIDTNTRSSANPNGIFHIWNWCDGQGGDPPGDGAFFRIQEHQNPPNTAGDTAYGNFVFDTPSHVHFKQAGGYTRQPASFHDGWRSRFWVASCCSTAEILSQWRGHNLTSTFAAHIWPYGGTLWDFNRFVFELRCVRPGRCDVSGDVKTDLNGLVFLLSDDSNSTVGFTHTSSAFLSKKWVKGTQNVTFDVGDLGSGLRNERMLIDGAQRWNWDHGGECRTSWTGQNGEWAREYRPCPTGGPWGRNVAVNTATLADGEHTVRLCTEDYGQYQGHYGTKGETCTQRNVLTDNTAPGKAASLAVTSANPARYLDTFGAQFSLPPNAGSPIKKVHYWITNASGEAVMPGQVVTGTNPTSIKDIKGPTKPGAYTLNLVLEDEVGFVGPPATVAIPHDTTPPAAPQNLRVLGTTTRSVPKFDLSWTNIVDNGSPIDAAHYNVVDGSGNVIRSARTLTADAIDTLRDIDSPDARDAKVQVWLSDAEGNVGAPAAVPVPRDTKPPAAPQDVALTPPATPRAAQGFDVQWRNIVDDGSPINAVHYRVLDDGGKTVVPKHTVSGNNPQAIPALDTPRGRGTHTLELWLSDAEGNVGAPVKAPLAFNCVRADAATGLKLTAGLGRKRHNRMIVPQGRSVPLRGNLGGRTSGVAGVPVCIFSRVVTHNESQFLGIALTGKKGRWRFTIGAGPSRQLSAVYRADHRELTETVVLASRVRPRFRLLRRPVRNGTVAVFVASIPGPDKAGVVLVPQVKSGKGWRAFRRCRTYKNGRCKLRYRFTQTFRPTTYIMRLQVRWQRGYPWLPGASRRIEVPVRP